jgi:hypothetical protein
MQEVLQIVARKGGPGRVERSETGTESWRRRRLVAGEETRSRGRGQHLGRHARESWAERYEMEPGMPHLLCFLAARIAQPYDCLEREPVRLKGWRGRFHARLCKIADRLAEYTLHILKQIRGTRPRPLGSARLREGRQDRSSHLPWAMGRFVFGPFSLGCCVLGARE